MRAARAALTGLALGALTLATAGGTAAGPAAVAVSVTPKEPHPGDVVLVQLAGARPGVRVEWNGQPLHLFPVRDGLAAVVGVDLDTPPGRIAWRVVPETVAGGSRLSGAVLVRAKTFPVQHLTLPPNQVDLDPPTLARVESEQRELAAVLADSAPERLWQGPFRVPVDGGRPTGGFGLRRMINGQPRSPHAGFDWAAPEGTPVLAANTGRVALVAEHFFAGRNVVLDHGLGLFTLYFHLSEVRVARGETVASGQSVGAVGATGRVTGPHLHFAVILGGARVDPESLLALLPPADPAP
jgi:murein DD-endopeptidase MepM/ murein hydrolase activator NlpD